MKHRIWAALITCISLVMAMSAQAQIPFTKTPVDITFGISLPHDIAVGYVDGDMSIDLVADEVDLVGNEDYLSWYPNLDPGFSEVKLDTEGHIEIHL